MLPNLSVLWVIALVLILTFVLNRFLFRPITRVMQERIRRVESAEALAEESAAQAEAATREFEDKTAAARADLYRRMDDMRRDALKRRADLLAATRKETELAIADAAARVQAESVEARTRLTREAETLGVAVAERVLGQKVS